jgi:hypothetical protein
MAQDQRTHTYTHGAHACLRLCAQEARVPCTTAAERAADCFAESEREKAASAAGVCAKTVAEWSECSNDKSRHRERDKSRER